MPARRYPPTLLDAPPARENISGVRGGLQRALCNPRSVAVLLPWSAISRAKMRSRGMHKDISVLRFEYRQVLSPSLSLTFLLSLFLTLPLFLSFSRSSIAVEVESGFSPGRNRSSLSVFELFGLLNREGI